MGLALTQIETICASKSSTATFQPIIAHYLALNILYHTLSGNIRDAHSSARKANRMANVMSDDLTIPVSTYIVKLRPRDEPLNKQLAKINIQEEGTEYADVIKVRWLSKTSIQAIHCLISGISYLQDTSSTKAKDYFELGIATITGESRQQTI